MSKVWPIVLGLSIADCDTHTRVPYTVVSPPRDWTAHPAIVQVTAPPSLYALSDVHGGYDRLVALLVANHLLAALPATPTDAVWSGGTAWLIETGDLMDKGPSSLEAIDLLRALEPQANAAGGGVIVTLGNHEGEFLNDPENSKATATDGVDTEIHARGLTPLALANGSDPRGAWLRDRPFGARVGVWFFSHAGNTSGRTIDQLEHALEDGVRANDYNDPEVIGANSILEARGWYGTDPTAASHAAQALQVRHFVFGHQPDALGPTGAIASAFDGLLFRIDCGMSPDVNYSAGCLLRINHDSTGELVEAVDATGAAKEIWRGQ